MSKTKILLADDSLFMRQMLKKILASGGYTDIIEACDGAEAVSAYKKEKPDIVLLDIVMEKKDGMQVLSEILNVDPDAAIIMVTAIRQEEHMEKANKIGAKAYISKPFKQEEILQAIKKLSE